MQFGGKAQEAASATGDHAGPTQLRARELIPWILLWALAAGIATLVALHALHDLVIATSLVWGLALYVTGVLAGFIFGIPKIPDIEVNAPGPATDSRSLPDGSSAPGAAAGTLEEVPAARPIGARRTSGINSNLVEVSDWLTKIIVGVGLVELKNLPEYGESLARFMSRSLAPDTAVDRIRPELVSVAGAIALFFGVLGFITGYLMTRIYLAVIMNDADRSAEQVSSWRLPSGGVVSTSTMLGNLRSMVEDLQQQVAQRISPSPTESTAPVGSAAAAPEASADEGSTPSAATAAARPGVVTRVLWVDDKPENNALLIDRLQRSGAFVHLVRRTDEALRELSRSSYDVLITDMMRKENTPDNLPAGLSLLKQTRELFEQSGGGSGPKPAQIVYCGKKSQLVYGRTAMEYGAQAVTSSPVEMLSILSRVIPGFEP